MKGLALLRLSSVSAITAGMLSCISFLLTEGATANLLPAALARALWALP